MAYIFRQARRFAAAKCRPELFSTGTRAGYIPQTRLITTTPTMKSSVDDKFKATVASINQLTAVDNDTKLKFYGLFKQATEGACNTPKPGTFDFVGKAKWEAWKTLGGISNEEAKKKYISLAESLLPKGSAAGGNANGSAEDSGVDIKVADGVLTVKLNRPAKMNSLTLDMYTTITNAFNKYSDSEDVHVAVLTGSGPYYSSGTDLSMFIDAKQSLEELSKGGAKVMVDFVDSFIDFKKPLVAAVNGPALGITVTTLALCDFVYASSRATFQTPFAATGQSPEGCSSYTFPLIMGSQKANELLLLGRKISAQEASNFGLVSAVFPHESFAMEVQQRVKALASLPPRSLQAGKMTIKEQQIPLLKEINRREAQLLQQRWQDSEYQNAVKAFAARAKK